MRINWGQGPLTISIIYDTIIMGIQRIGGFVFKFYKYDHPPLHVHVYDKDGRCELGRWDIENQRGMDHLVIGKKLRKALKMAGYLE